MGILEAIVKTTQARLDAKGLDAATEALVSKKLDMTWEEHFYWQEEKSLKVAEGVLDAGVGTEMYQFLGNSVDHFNAQPLAVKMAVQLALAEMMKGQISQLA